MKMTQRMAIALTALNLVILVVLLTRDNSAHAKDDEGSVLRGRSLELIDADGTVRAQFNIESDGEAVFRMRDRDGNIRVKLGAGESGSGLVLMDEATEPGIQMLARPGATEGSSATSITLSGTGGSRRVITP